MALAIAPQILCLVAFLVVIWAILDTINDNANQYQKQIIQSAIEAKKNTIRLQTDLITRNDRSLVLLYKNKPRAFEWIKEQQLKYFQTYYQHSHSFILNPDGILIDGLKEKNSIKSEDIEFYQKTLNPFIRKYLSNAQKTPIGTQSNFTSFIKIENKIYFISASALWSETGTFLTTDSGRWSLLSLAPLDQTFLDSITEPAFLGKISVSTHPKTTDIPLFDQNKNLIAGIRTDNIDLRSDIISPLIALLISIGILTTTLVFLLFRGLRSQADLLIESEERANKIAFTDALTSLPNRIAFNQALHTFFSTPSIPILDTIVMSVDLDHFKAVNDTGGHQAGDQLIREVGQRLCQACRKQDLVSRLGGDEFALIIQEKHVEAHAEDIAKRIINAIQKPFIIDGIHYHIGVSVGIAKIDQEITTPDEVFRRADMALYRVKSEGRNGFAWYDSSLDHERRHRNRLKSDLRAALLANDQLRLHYQPILDLKTRQVVALEALVRWTHPQLGEQSPQEFISIAEETGLIQPLSEWVLKTVGAAQKQILDLKFCVNISTLQLRKDTFIPTITELKAQNIIDTNRMCFEITESFMIQDDIKAQNIFKFLKDINIDLALDDFGEGYSSLNYLTRFDFDIIKLDRRLIKDMISSDIAFAGIRSLIDLSLTLDAKIIAEGVEDETRLKMLLDLGCPLAQGFFFAKPMPLDDLLQHIHARGLEAFWPATVRPTQIS